MVLVAAGVAVALQGPLKLPMLARLIEERISREGLSLSIGAASIDVSSGFPARLELANAAIDVAGRNPVTVTLPRVTAPLGLASILSGEVALSAIVVEQPRLYVQPGGAARTDVPEMSAIAEAGDNLALLALDQLSGHGVERIELLSAEVLIRAARTHRIGGIDAVLTRDDAQNLRMEADIAGRLGRWTATLTRRIDEETADRRLSIDLRDITLGELLPIEAQIRAGKGLGVPVRTRLETVTDADGAFARANLGLRVSPGWINTGKTVISFDRIDTQLQWRKDEPGFRIAPSSYLRGNTLIPFEGRVEPPRAWQEMWSFQIAARDGRIGPGDVPGPPFVLNSMVIGGRADLSGREFHFDAISMRAGTATLDGVGSLRLSPAGPYLALALNSGAMPVATLKRIWPITLVPPARAWVIEHMLEGRVLGGQATIALQPPVFDITDLRPGWSGDDISVAIDFSDVSLKTLGTVPIAQGLAGRLSVADEMLTVEAKTGAMIAGSGGPVDIELARFTIPDLRKPGRKTGVLDIITAGPAPALARVLNSEPFEVLTKNDLAPENLSGQGAMTLAARFSLVKDLRIDDVDWQLTGRLSDFESDVPIRGYDIADADLNFDADDSRLILTGRGRLDGLPANLDLVVPLGEGAEDVVARQGVEVEATAAQLAARGVDLTEFLRGAMRLSTQDADDGGQLYQVDLTRTRIEIAELGWVKASGVPARAAFTLRDQGDVQDITGFRLTSEGVDIEGTMTLRNGSLALASFSNFSLRPSDDATLRVESVNGGYQVDLRAESFDGRGLLSSLTKGDAEDGDADADPNDAPRLSIVASIDRLTGFNGVSLTNLTIRGQSVDGRVEALTASGETGGRDRFDVNMSGRGAERTLDATFADTGAILRFTDLYKRMRGGAGRLTVAMPGDETWDGRFQVRQLAITEDPAIKALSQTQTLRNPDRRGRETLAGSVKRGEASFSELDLNFMRRGDMLTVTDGNLTGPSVGGTVSGQISLRTRTLDMTGTFVPIFALNNLFSRIPLLGFALGGGSDEGLIGVTYRLSGLISDPVLTVNPASAIAPGIFRRMFEYR